MKLRLVAMIAFILALSLLPSCQPTSSKPVKPNYAVSTPFDGQGYGERINHTPATMCQLTAISGSITQGVIDFTLHYNNTRLTGWIAENGTFKLQDDSIRWDYFFPAKPRITRSKAPGP